MRKLITLLLAVLLVVAMVPAVAEEAPITLASSTSRPATPSSRRPCAASRRRSELGFEFVHNGPADSSNEGQIQIIEGFIQQEVDAIAISANDAAGVVSVLQTAMDAGIKVVSFDSAVNPEGRNLNIDPSLAQNIGRVQAEEHRLPIES